MKHKHHIIPKHMGGTDEPTNIIELSISDHAEAHRLLWEQHGLIGDFVAWKMLSGKSEDCENERLRLAKEGFKQFQQSSDYNKWKQKISNSLTGKIQSEESKLKRSNSLKRCYAQGKRDTWFKYADKSFFKANYNSEKMAEGRRNSLKWKESVTSQEYRKLKSKLDPRSKHTTINGVQYSSIRSAAKELNIPYSRLRSILNGENNITL
jgi:hypothetical protein